MDAQRRRLTVGRVDPSERTGGARASGRDQELAAFIHSKRSELGEVTIVHSVTDKDLKKKRSFSEKDQVMAASSPSSENFQTLTQKELEDLGTAKHVNYTCKKGLKPESPNQDSFVVLTSKDWSFYGVFDGHGPNGHDVSNYAVKVLVQEFLNDSEMLSNTGDALKRAFVTTQQSIQAVPKKDMDSSTSGSTCTIAFHHIATDVLTLGHVGDSRAVLYSWGERGGEAAVLQATEDHKPNLPEEKRRIEANGGRVVFDGYYNYRVFAQKGMYPGLNMSRALGDVIAHQEAGLTAEPEISVKELKGDRAPGKQLTLLVCSDGVWEFIENPNALGFLKGEGGYDLRKVGDLAQSSWDKWMEDSDNEISDDITVMAVHL